MANRIFRSARGNPRTLSHIPVAGALLPGTAVFVGATLAQAATASGGRLALLGDRDYYGLSAAATEPLLTPYVSGETGIAYLLEPQDEVQWAFAAGTYTYGQELTIGAAGRLVAAAATNIVVAHFDQAGATLAAGALADVCITNFYTKA
ncbi:MAG: hypothetical protein Q7T78_17055 [Rhodoferax sp.]|nr:hypothetical protein [Rhodoferax sp.]